MKTKDGNRYRSIFEPSMKTAGSGAFEYYTLRPLREATKKEASDPIAELNELGDEGWELVESIEYAGDGTKFLVLKRPKTSGSTSQ